MVMYKTNWKWQKTEDVCWYTEADVEMIKAPKLLKKKTILNLIVPKCLLKF